MTSTPTSNPTRSLNNLTAPLPLTPIVPVFLHGNLPKEFRPSQSSLETFRHCAFSIKISRSCWIQPKRPFIWVSLLSPASSCPTSSSIPTTSSLSCCALFPTLEHFCNESLSFATRMERNLRLPDSLRIISILNTDSSSVALVEVLTPYLSLKDFISNVHELDFMTEEYGKAVGGLLKSADKSLERLVLSANNESHADDVDLDPFFNHIDLSRTAHLQRLTLDINTDDPYLIPFLTRLARNSELSNHPPSLKFLTIPYFIRHEEPQQPTNPERMDELLQHSYFSMLRRFNCKLYTWEGEVDEMKAKKKQLEAKVPNLTARQVLKVQEVYMKRPQRAMTPIRFRNYDQYGYPE
ncbi:hypothetical protein D9758_003464 [Tetrapyrgos nigripes]|uniref:Uncharacterized protein n=1 Tax=Tetrapyrgos nigripes TaxID=182062 RepID=A0A8H5LWC3_9AGAR|nr:hypothetical protein D9758_003464 [Tetrapyrgos nigripes]